MLRLFNKVPKKQFLYQMAEWLCAHEEKSAARKVIAEILQADPSDKAARALYAEAVWKPTPDGKESHIDSSSSTPQL